MAQGASLVAEVLQLTSSTRTFERLYKPLFNMTTSPASVSKLTALEAATSLSSNIRDKTVLITGTSPNSLGATTALAIASASPKLLILATRDSTKNEQTASKIRQSFPETNLKLVTLDLASLSS